MSEPNGNEPKQIYGLMAKILSEVGTISKTRRNEQQGYAFRGVDDMYNTLHPLFAEHGVFNTPRVLHKSVSERVTNSGSTLRFVELTVAYDFFASDGSSVTVETVGEAMDAGDKASNKALSAAHKYALIQAFCIPTGEAPDADFDSPPATRPKHASRSDIPACPDCGGQMWDNRATKKGRQPDFKCRDKSCDKAVWVDDAPKETPEQAAIRELMAQAERLLPSTSVKLAELRKITDANELGRKVQILLDLKRDKDNSARAVAPQNQELIAAIRHTMSQGKTDESAYLAEHYPSKALLEDLTFDQLIVVQDDVVPF